MKVELNDIQNTINQFNRPYGMHPKEYKLICDFINDNNIHTVADVGVGKGLSYIMMSRFTETEIYPVDGYVDNYIIGSYLPKDAFIYYLKLPDELSAFETFLEKKSIEFVLLDDGHKRDTVILELLACWNKGIRYVALHDTNTELGEALKFTDGLYKVIDRLDDYNGLCILEKRDLLNTNRKR